MSGSEQNSQCSALALLDQLIGSWSDWPSNGDYYINQLVPSIVLNTEENLTHEEKEIIAELRGLLSAAKWEELPRLISDRRAGNLKKAQREIDRIQAAEISAKKSALVARVRKALEADYLGADALLRKEPDWHLVADVYAEQKSRFAQAWAKVELGLDLDLEQSRGVSATGGDVQAIARAGAGKTRTLVTRALFLRKHCGVSAKEILLLAFNKNAAEEMRNRLREELGEDVGHVMTFHSLAYAIVHPDEDIIFDEPSSGNLRQSHKIQHAIDENLRKDRHQETIQKLMLLRFREDWEKIAAAGFHLTKQKFLEFPRELVSETLRGDYVKSFGEKLIANTLFEHGIDYTYDRPYRRGKVDYRPDFVFFGDRGLKVVLEYFGLKGDPDYDEMSQKKRDFWGREDGWQFIEYSPEDIVREGPDGFSRLVVQRLSGLGVKVSRLTEDEIWSRIKTRAIDRFTVAMRSFVNRCRKANLSSQALEQLRQRHAHLDKAEGMFLRIGCVIYKRYLQLLSEQRQIDFDDLIWKAVDHLAAGRTSFVRDRGQETGDVRNLRFVLVDEFQDFTKAFDAVLHHIRRLNTGVEFFCVGDDWQAINTFAGSDPSFFQDFHTQYRSVKQVRINTNYRSPKLVVELGNAVMEGNGKPARPGNTAAGRVRLALLSDFIPNLSERAAHTDRKEAPAVLRLVRQSLNDGHGVALLARKKDAPGYVNWDLQRFTEHLRTFLPPPDRDRIYASTVHSFKGKEEDAVVVLDANTGSYPLIHPTWDFGRIHGDTLESIEAEERRLFYVAVTRARHTLSIVCDSRERTSRYVKEIERRVKLDNLDWQDLPPVIPERDEELVEIRISGRGTYEVREDLKALGYSWNNTRKSWERLTLASEFDTRTFRSQFLAPGITISVYSQLDELLSENVG